MVTLQRRGNAAGFTLIEVCIAMMILTLAIAGVGHMSIVALNATQAARVQTSTAILASQKLEQLRALVWTVDVNGQPLSDWSTDLAVEPATAAGAGLRPSPANSLDVSAPGYADYLDSRGQWVGTGPTPPAATRYIRRWNVRPLPEDAQDTVILEVLVTTIRRDRLARPPRRRLPDDALVTTMVSRKAH